VVLFHFDWSSIYIFFFKNSTRLFTHVSVSADTTGGRLGTGSERADSTGCYLDDSDQVVIMNLRDIVITNFSEITM